MVEASLWTPEEIRRARAQARVAHAIAVAQNHIDTLGRVLPFVKAGDMQGAWNAGLDGLAEAGAIEERYREAVLALGPPAATIRIPREEARTILRDGRVGPLRVAIGRRQ